MNRVRQKQWDVTSEIWLQKDGGFYFGHILFLSLSLPPHPVFLSLKKKPPKTKETVARLSNPMEKPRVEGWVSLASSQQDLRPSVQQPWRNGSLLTVTAASWEADPPRAGHGVTAALAVRLREGFEGL